MSSLSHLRSALRRANSGSLHGLTFDTKLLDSETAKMCAWLGDRGSVNRRMTQSLQLSEPFSKTKNSKVDVRHFTSASVASTQCFLREAG